MKNRIPLAILAVVALASAAALTGVVFRSPVSSVQSYDEQRQFRFDFC